MEPIHTPHGAEPCLDAALRARLRALPAPDPGPEYFDALPERVSTRVRREGRRAPTPAAASDRAPVRRGTRRRQAVWALTACAVLVVLVWGLPRVRREAPQKAQLAQQRLPDAPTARPNAPAMHPPADPVARPVPPTPVQKERTPRRTSRPEALAPKRREATTARPRGALTLAGTDVPDRLPVPPALVHTLERARVVLLTLAHADSTDDLGVLQPLAEALVADLGAQRAAFDEADPALRTVADRLEPLLLTLAHPDGTPAAMATLRTRIREDETLFRLNVALLAAAPAVPVD